MATAAGMSKGTGDARFSPSPVHPVIVSKIHEELAGTGFFKRFEDNEGIT
jgi:hypothetical protein